MKPYTVVFGDRPSDVTSIKGNTLQNSTYPSKSLISRLSDTDYICCFCNNEKEILTHLFFDCNVVNKFWIDLADFIFHLININYCVTLNDFKLHYENKSNMDLEFIVNLFILLAQFHIHTQFLYSSPMLNLFCFVLTLTFIFLQ